MSRAEKFTLQASGPAMNRAIMRRALTFSCAIIGNASARSRIQAGSIPVTITKSGSITETGPSHGQDYVGSYTLTATGTINTTRDSTGMQVFDPSNSTLT